MAKARATANASRELSFRVAGEVFSLPTANIVEVIRLPAMTRVPLSPPSLAGVFNFHGAAVPAMKLDWLLDLRGSSLSTRVIVYQAEETVGLLVDDIVQLGQAGRKRSTAGLIDVDTLLTKHWGRVASRPVRPGKTQAAVFARPVVLTRTRTVLEFAVGDQNYALPVEAVREIARLPDNVAALSGGAATLGVTDIRNKVVPLVSLACLLGIDVVAPENERAVVVTEVGPWWVGLVTGAVDKIVRLPEDSIEPVPPLLQRGKGTAEIDGIGRLDRGRALISILSPAKLFDTEIVASALSKIEQGEAAVAAVEKTASEQFVVLNLGGERYGLPIASVDEIVQLPSTVTRLPKAPGFVTGVINLRGKALPLIDQRKRFDAEAETTERRPRVVVITVDGVQAGFIVDGVSEIVRIPADAVRPAPQMPGDGGQIFDRAAPLGAGDQLVLLVDPHELLNAAERDLLAHLKLDGRSAKS